MGVVKFYMCALLVLVGSSQSRTKSLYEHNPFFAKVPIVAELPNVVHSVSLAGNSERHHTLHLAIPPAAQQPGLHFIHPSSNTKHHQPEQVHPLNPVQPQHPSQPSPPVAVPANPQHGHVPAHPHTPMQTDHSVLPSPPIVPPVNPVIPPTQGPVVAVPPPVYQEPDPEVSYLRQFCIRSRGQFANSKCNKFVNCWDNTAVEQFCPDGLAFNPAGYCDYLYNVDCKGRSFEVPPALPPQPSVDHILPSTPSISNNLPQVPVTIPPQNPSTVNQPLPVPPQNPFLVPQNPSVANPHPSVPSHPPTVGGISPHNPFLVPQNPSATTQAPHPPAVPSNPPVVTGAPPQNPFLVPHDPSGVNPVALVPSNPPPVTGLPPLNPFLPSNISTLLWQASQKPAVVQHPLPVPQQPAVHQPVSNFINGNPQPLPSAPLNLIPAGSAPANPRLLAKCGGLRGQFASDSCNKYIDCWDGNAVELDCPPGLYFSEKGYCDYSFNVNCQNRAPIKSQIKDSQCPSPNGTFRDKSDCGRYFTCISNEVVTRYDCPAGLYFNEVVCVCDYASNVNCAREPFVYQPPNPVETLNKLPAAAVDKTLECKPGRVFKLNSHCSSVVLCRSGSTEAIHCPEGLVYDAPSDRCLPPQLARCESS